MLLQAIALVVVHFARQLILHGTLDDERAKPMPRRLCHGRSAALFPIRDQVAVSLVHSECNLDAPWERRARRIHQSAGNFRVPVGLDRYDTMEIGIAICAFGEVLDPGPVCRGNTGADEFGQV